MEEKHIKSDKTLEQVYGGKDATPILRKDVEYRANEAWLAVLKTCIHCKKHFVSWYGENICEECEPYYIEYPIKTNIKDISTQSDLISNLNSNTDGFNYKKIFNKGN